MRESNGHGNEKVSKEGQKHTMFSEPVNELLQEKCKGKLGK